MLEDSYVSTISGESRCANEKRADCHRLREVFSLKKSTSKNVVFQRFDHQIQSCRDQIELAERMLNKSRKERKPLQEVFLF